MTLRPISWVFALLLGSATLAHAATTIERSFGYDRGRLRVVDRLGYTAVELPGALRETRAGHPDLPWLSERVDLPPGTKVTAVEVADVQTRVLGTASRMASAVVPQAGIGPVERSKPDARWFGAATAQPEDGVALGAQGDLRGHDVAYLRVCPVQWLPATGEVRVITRLTVRLTLEPSDAPALRRERIVPAWEEDGLGTGVPTRALAATLSPAPKPGATPFAAQQVPSVLGSPVEYVIVTSDAMAPIFQQLADWKTQTGVPAVVRTMSFVRQQYPAAADDAERVRLFLRDCYTRWSTKWALLGGDTDVIPTRYGTTTFYGGANIATDLYFSCLDGNWDADGDSLWGEGYSSTTDPGDNADLMPELYVGRASVSTPEAAQTFVNKTLQYEKTPLGNYEQGWLFAAEVLFPQPWNPGDPVDLDGAAMAEQMLALTDEKPELHVGRLYENYTDTTWRLPVWPESRATVIDSMNVGAGLILHVGHGYRNVMEMGDVSMTNADASALTNGNRLFNLYSINCSSVAIDYPCIGEAFILNPNGGAITNVGSTNLDFPSTGQSYQYEYFRMFIEDGVSAIGELQAKQKIPFIAYSSYDGVNRWTQMTLLLLGDPELRMWLGQPRTLAVTAPASIALSDTQFTVHVTQASLPLAGATVTAWKPGDDYASVMTDVNGDAVMPFRPDSLGTLSLAVTAYNSRPWTGSVAIGSTALASLSLDPVTIDDDNVGGTVGDGNGSLDAGETVDLIVPVRNRGGSGATGVTATLSTTDSLVALPNASATYGGIAAGAAVTAAVPFRLVVPYTVPDQRELPFTVVLTDDAGQVYRQKFQLTVHAPELRSFSHGETETVGNNDGRPQAGETVNYFINLRNGGTGTAHGVTLLARSVDGLATLSDSTASFGDIAPGATGTGDAITFVPTTLGAKFDLIVSTASGVLATQRIDLTYPSAPTRVIGIGGASSIALEWTHMPYADLYGYNVYRSSSSSGPFTLVNPVPTGRIAAYTDENLLPLTRYYYEVATVDSSGNASAVSAAVSTSTNPPSHTVFPVPMGENTPAPVAIDYLYSNQWMDIAAGSDVVYVLHADGTPPVDADGVGATLGDFTTRGHYYAAGPSIATLDPADGPSVIAASWDSMAVYVFDRNGHVRPGWPFYADSPIWTSVACADLDGDGKMELVFASNGNKLYVLRSDGTEWMDGDNNPATKGVFKVLGDNFNYASPALADLDGDGHPEIIYGSYDGNMYVWKADGTNLPGWPYACSGVITGSPAVACIDGPSDTVPELIWVSADDTLHVMEPNGKPHPGFPLWMRTDGTTKSPSPAIADLDNDGYLDIIVQTTNGYILSYNHNGTGVPHMWGLRYSVKTSAASECSPVVADLDGDGWNDVLCGDENGLLTAFSGATGAVMAGFPIQLGAEVRGTPAVGDIDGDGKTEIVVAGWDKNLYVWDYDFPFQPSGQAPWPQFMHDARRTGNYNAPQFNTLGVGPGGDAAPVRTLEFAPPAPNPAARATTLSFGIPSSLAGQRWQLAIYDLGGRRVRLVDSGVARAGRLALKWDLRDEARMLVAGGVYFARFDIGASHSTRKLVVLQ